MKNILEKAGIDFSDAEEDLICYGFDASRVFKKPSLIVWPKSTDEIVMITKAAFERTIPIVPRGAGTATTGAAVPSEKAVVMSFEKMDRILEVDTKNQTVVVEPGLINGRLQKELELLDFFYPPDPSSMEFCTIGGNVAVNAGGPRALKYGVTGDYVLEIEAVTADGSVIKTGRKTFKGVVGYDLKSLLIGSEGTLAIISKIRLRIVPVPEAVLTMIAIFKSIEQSGSFVTEVLNRGILPRCLELMDRYAIEAVEEYKPTGLPLVDAMLLVEIDGAYSTVKENADIIADICRSKGGEIQIAEDSISRDKLWQARRAIAPALHHLAPDKINHDIVVPRTEIPNMLKFLRNLSERHSIKIVCFGHAGDGNLHVNIMLNRENKEEYKKAQYLAKEIIEETLRLGGTISGEHGIGLTKSDYLTMELGNKEIDLMRGIKRLFDYKNILNPGKIFP